MQPFWGLNSSVQRGVSMKEKSRNKREMGFRHMVSPVIMPKRGSKCKDVVLSLVFVATAGTAEKRFIKLLEYFQVSVASSLGFVGFSLSLHSSPSFVSLSLEIPPFFPLIHISIQSFDVYASHFLQAGKIHQNLLPKLSIIRTTPSSTDHS